MTDPGPIKLHGFQEPLSLMRVVSIVSHAKECGFSLDKAFSELLPVRFRRPTTFQYSGTLRNYEIEGNTRLRPTKCQPQDKMSNVVLPPLLIQIDGFSGIVAKRDILPTLIPHNFLQFFRWSVSGPGGFDFSQHSQSVDGKQLELFDRHVVQGWFLITGCRKCPNVEMDKEKVQVEDVKKIEGWLTS